MMKKRHILHWAMGVILTPLLGSCTTDDVVGGAGREECDIMSGQPMTVTSATKANDGRTSSTQFEKDEIVWLWAKKTDGTDYIRAWQLTAQGGGSFTGTDKYWPSDGSKLNFHALHGNFTESDLNNNWSDLTSLTHTVLPDQSSVGDRRQSDLLFAEKAEATHGNNVELSFSHLLAKITVKLDLKNSTGITTNDFENAIVSIMGIKPEATFDSSAKTASTSGGTETNIQAGTITKPTELTSEAYDAGCAIVPLQTIAAEQQLIKITLNDRTFIYKASEETTFQKGMEYTYTLTILGEKISGSLSVSPFSPENRPISFNEYFDYLADLENRNYLGSSAEPHDLSLDYNGLMNTANCYVVTHPGYYKFPLVYGNAIKNGATNDIAYGVGTNSTTFVNHLGNQISDPYIYKNANCTIGSAELVWQDAPNLISNNIALCDNDTYISFEITKANIQQGNAVIAVKDGSGNIMWSWHIWVTNKNVYETYTYGDYKFMPIALGQRETDEGTTCTFYQWGRKDPFKWATANGQTTENTSPQTYYYSSILNPDKFFLGTSGSYYNWFNGNLLDLWNVGNTSIEKTTSTSQKTIYDPSPVGFKVPPPAAFTAIGLSHAYWNSTSGQEGIKVPATGDFWRAFGYLEWKRGSSVVFAGVRGHYWSCGPSENNSDHNGWFLNFNLDAENPKDKSYRSYGFTVRPVSE